MDKALVVIEQRTVDFYGDELLAVRAGDGQVYLSLRHSCEGLGLARQGQVPRIHDDKILSEGYQGGNVFLPPSPDGRGGDAQSVLCLPLDDINGHQAVRTRHEHGQGLCPGVVAI